MADIARAAGVTAPSLYRHFADKQALLYAAVLAGVDDLQTCTDTALAAADGDSEAFIAAMCGSMARRQNASTLWRWTGTYLTSEQNREVVQGTRAVLRQWAELLFADRDLLDWEQRQLVWTLLSVVGSLSVHRARLSSAQSVLELTAAAVRLVALTPSDAIPLRVPPHVDVPGDDRRSEILDAAARLFSERGYGPVTVDEIGAAVGITGPSVYKHFPSKATILIEIGRRSGARLEVGVIAAYSAGSDDTERLALMVDSYVGAITSMPDLSVSFNNASALADDPSSRELLDIQRRYVRRWSTLMTSIHEIGDAEAAVAVHAALSIVNDAVRVRRGTERPGLPRTDGVSDAGSVGVVTRSTCTRTPHDHPRLATVTP
ncbi:TetR/AcrR family transcriptional regulator [Gordonia humi]|uniref:TetR/AcrR family transcriptional regulator n=1 Tax=Gordonia humi TaxID=686429 RepID=UPI00362100C3